MTTVKKKRVRVVSPASDSDDEDRGNPKPHEDGDNGGKSRVLVDNHVDETANVVKSTTCFVCGGKDNWVLVCHEEECPVAIHQSCASDEPDFDEFGNFYCPYCWYKRVLDKSMNLQKKLRMAEKFSIGRETSGRVDSMHEVTEDAENVVRVSVTRSNPSGNTREGDESYEKFMVLEKNQRMKEIEGDADVDDGTQQGERFSENNQETSDACSSGGGGRNVRARYSENNRDKVQVRNSDVCEERKQLRRCDTNHETVAEPHSSDAGVKTRKQRINSEKGQGVKRVARTHKRGVFIIDDGAPALDSDMGEGRSGQGFVDENNQQKKASSTESCAQEVHRIDKRVLHGSGSELGEGSYRQGRHLRKNQHSGTVETHEKNISEDGKRKREGAVDRDGNDKQCQVDTKNDDATLSDQENGFSKDEQVERNYVSSSITSPTSIDNVKMSSGASQQLALIIHPTYGLQGQPIHAQPIETRPPYCSASSKKPSFQPEKYERKRYMEKNGSARTDPKQRKVVMCSDRKRKRLFWTQAEEEMLRAGVQKFPGYRNIPWRKILEYGRDVFQEERLPSDLKDKWKKMSKTWDETGKWVSLPTERQPNHSHSASE